MIDKIMNSFSLNQQLDNNIDQTNWKNFKIGDVFPKVRVKKYSTTPFSNGKIPFISAQTENNGIRKYVDEPSIPGNCITVTTNGIYAFTPFYQKDNIAISSDVEVLYNENLNENIGLFIVSILYLEKQKWDYLLKPKKDAVFDTIIKLPSKNGQPDWDFMDKFISQILKMLNLDKVKKLTKNLQNIILNNHFVANDNWDEFYLNSEIKNGLFDLEIAKSTDQFLYKFGREGINYISRTTVNNGRIGRTVDYNADNVNKGKCISIAMVGQYLGTAFWQDEDFLSSQNMLLLRSKNLTKKIAFFIIPILEKEIKGTFVSHVNTFNKKNAEVLKIKLPSKNGKPDYEHMVDWINAIYYKINE